MTLISTIVLNRAIDPSQTTSLRNAFSRGIKRRFLKFKNTVTQVIVEDDVFGMATNASPGQGAFRFPQSADQIGSFMRWIGQEIQTTILETSQPENAGRSSDSAWTNLYIQEAYRRGVAKARSQMKGFAPALSATGGLEVAMMALAHVDHKGALYIRMINELKGVTDAMFQQISRVVTQGVVDGVAPRIIAWQISQVILPIGSGIAVNAPGMSARDRAELAARTEIIRTYAEAQLTEFELWGVYGVSVKAEFMTAGDERVCPKCNALSKHLYTIDEARGVIPVHPKCRCVWVPNLTN